VAVTIEAPLHLQRRLAPHHRHFVDAAMAFDASDAPADVNAVVEVHEPGQIMYP
jgi:hypothetical protein